MIEAQGERFAPGIRELIAARSTMGPAEVERRNPNYVGGDINGGAQTCASSLPPGAATGSLLDAGAWALHLLLRHAPGGGVHGTCGYFAAQAALRGVPPA